MTLEEFLQQYTGKEVDFDKALGVQCMDLMHYYHYEVLGLKEAFTLSQPEAKRLFTNFENVKGREYFEKIANTPDNVPQKGDIIIWGEPYGKYTTIEGQEQFAGHVAIFIEGDVNTFRSFDANFGTRLPHIQEHNYAGVLGWLHFKGATEELKTVQLVQQELQVQIEATNICQTQLKTALEQNSAYQTQIDSYISQVNDLKIQAEDFRRKYEDEQRTVLDLKGELSKIHSQDKDYGQEALDAQHLAKERGDLLHMVGEAAGVQYDPTDDKKLVEEVLKEIAALHEQKEIIEKENKQDGIFKQLLSMGINNYLEAKGISPIAVGALDEKMEEKVVTYLKAVADELLSTPAETTVTPVIVPQKKKSIVSFLKPIIYLFFTPQHAESK